MAMKRFKHFIFAACEQQVLHNAWIWYRDLVTHGANSGCCEALLVPVCVMQMGQMRLIAVFKQRDPTPWPFNSKGN